MLGLMLLALVIIAPTLFIYFLAVKAMDRYEPEPWWLLTVMFLYGALGSTLFAIIGNEIGQAGIGVALGGGQNAALVKASTATFVAPFVEESTKGFGLLALWGMSALWLREVDGPLDGAIYGGVVGLGFTLTEDVLYVANAGAQSGGLAFFALYILRTVLAGLGHATFTAMTGLGIGIAIETRSTALKFLAPIAGWTAAVGLHFLHNLLVTFLIADGGGFVVKLLLFTTFDVMFFVLLFALAMRDRSIVLRGLVDEVGKSLHPKELQRTISLMMFMPFWNFFSLKGSPGGYLASRKKQLSLVELAFLKHRRRRGESGGRIDGQEQALRGTIDGFNQRGVFVGPR
jgi:protease PrsW